MSKSNREYQLAKPQTEPLLDVIRPPIDLTLVNKYLSSVLITLLAKQQVHEVGSMASEIEGDVKKTLLDRTDAEKVFRPWWDTVEDYLLNILIGLGKNIKKSILGKA